MSYLEKKYLELIKKIFKKLSNLEENLLDLLILKSIRKVDEIARSCAEFNKEINIVLKKYYPEIKEMDDKLNIKSSLKFYYDLIDKLTNYVRNVENFQKIDDKYYDALIDFIKDKGNLISGKYKAICTQELTAFYDPKSKQNLEKILADKILNKSRQFFTIGPLEEEIKKIGKIAGADLISIISVKSLKNSEIISPTTILESAQSIITFAVALLDNPLKIKIKTSDPDRFDKNKNEKLKIVLKIEKELKEYLNSKGFKVVTHDRNINLLKYVKDSTKEIMKELDLSRKYLFDGTVINNNHYFFIRSLISDAKLLPDSS
ncbi:MAG: hypothetical protein ACTSRI_20990 [Promethearchaeota archaeon]